MTAPAVHNGSPPAPSHSVPAVASGAIRTLLTRPPRTATVLGRSSAALWLDVTDDVLVIGGLGSIRLPNGIEADVPDLIDLAGRSAVVGGGHVRLGSRVLRVARWWVPRPFLPDIAPTELAEAAAPLPTVATGVPHELLRKALEGLDAVLLVDAARSLVGLGEGLTPAGDDYLAAAVATFRLMGEAAGLDTSAALIDAVALRLAELSEGRTTALSASLIRHALKGNVANPVAALLQALTGRGDVGRSVSTLEQVGHTSGRSLVAGVGLGVRSVIETIRARSEEATP